ncbi:MAG: fasciclin domain-containing protein [Anaerolineae bacterium]|nr:fasciclin domain-containing protein [Gemmatimonadaceae bacterium]
MKSLRNIALAAALAVPGALTGLEAQGHSDSASVVASGDIIETAVAAGSFKTLAAAIEAAGLTETLKGKGPFTVFAPTDEAFAKLPKGTVEALLKDKAKLTAILTYHVVPGAVVAKNVVRMSSAKTVNGETISIKAKKGKVKVNKANVTATDIVATNGVIHVIDQVLIPR